MRRCGTLALCVFLSACIFYYGDCFWSRTITVSLPGRSEDQLHQSAFDVLGELGYEPVTFVIYQGQVYREALLLQWVKDPAPGNDIYRDALRYGERSQLVRADGVERIDYEYGEIYIRGREQRLVFSFSGTESEECSPRQSVLNASEQVLAVVHARFGDQNVSTR